MVRAVWLAGVLLAGALVGAAAEDARPEMTPPRVTPVTVDWDAVRAEIADPAASPSAPLQRLNAMAGFTFAGIEKSSVPVLLPVDLDTLAKDAIKIDAAGFRRHFFHAGPSGYDAAFTLVEATAGEKEEPLVLITASSILYDLNPPVAEAARPSKELEQLIPDVRRRFLESYLRYSFERYGVTYTASMLCRDGSPRKRLVACTDAADVLVRFIKALRLAGGTPQPASASATTVERPDAPSPDFTYIAPGKLLRNTGFRGNDGRPDTTVYAKIRFPIGDAPAYANSQSFLNWGNCDFTGRTSHNWRKAAPYRCKVNDKPLVFDESAPENRSYPWRDNFCEHRRYLVGQCAGGEGHQGQDIRPSTCKLFNEGADRCTAYHDNVVAVRDGSLLRLVNRESVYLYVNAPGERLRFRYLHMHPKMLDADGVISGRAVREGEILGKVGNYDRIPNGTTYHLHFEMQVPTRDGWVFVNPYMTLVASYERLIGGRGRQVEDTEAARVEPAPKVDTPVEPATAPAANTQPAVPTTSAKPPAMVASTPNIIVMRPNAADKQHTSRAKARTQHAAAQRTAARRSVRAQATAKPAEPKQAVANDAEKKEAAGEQASNVRARAASGACKAGVSARGSQRHCVSRQSKASAGAKPSVPTVGQPIAEPSPGPRGI